MKANALPSHRHDRVFCSTMASLALTVKRARTRILRRRDCKGFFLRAGGRDGVLDTGSRSRETEICQMVTVVERDCVAVLQHRKELSLELVVKFTDGL